MTDDIDNDDQVPDDVSDQNEADDDPEAEAEPATASGLEGELLLADDEADPQVARVATSALLLLQRSNSWLGPAPSPSAMRQYWRDAPNLAKQIETDFERDSLTRQANAATEREAIHRDLDDRDRITAQRVKGDQSDIEHRIWIRDRLPCAVGMWLVVFLVLVLAPSVSGTGRIVLTSLWISVLIVPSVISVARGRMSRNETEVISASVRAASEVAQPSLSPLADDVPATGSGPAISSGKGADSGRGRDDVQRE